MKDSRDSSSVDAPVWRLGAIGFAYDDWAGSFYSRGLRAEDRLGWYAERLGAIELDTTFYATPRAAVVERWARVTPGGFRFAVKAPREVTHDPGPDDPGAAGRLLAFVEAMRGLGEKLGVVLLQFPPRCAVDCSGALRGLLSRLPRDLAYAVELRHPSWWTRAVVEMFRAFHTGEGLRVAWVGADYPTPESAGIAPAGAHAGVDLRRPQPLIHTGPLVYLRWVGNHGQLPRSDAEVLDPTPRLRWWADRLAPLVKPGTPVREVYGFFGNSYAGHAPATLGRFAPMMGLPGVAEPSPAPPRGGLFGEG